LFDYFFENNEIKRPKPVLAGYQELTSGTARLERPYQNSNGKIIHLFLSSDLYHIPISKQRPQITNGGKRRGKQWRNFCLATAEGKTRNYR